MIPILSLVLALSLAGSGGPAMRDEAGASAGGAARCRAAAGHRARPGGLDAIRLGMPVAALLRLCPDGRRGRDLDAEAMPIDIVALSPPSPAITVRIERGRIDRIDIRDPAIDDGHGNRPGRLLARGAARAGLIGIEGDGNLYLYRAGTCGVTFLIDHVPGDREHRDIWRARDIQALPPFRIREIGVHRC